MQLRMLGEILMLGAPLIHVIAKWVLLFLGCFCSDRDFGITLAGKLQENEFGS